MNYYPHHIGDYAQATAHLTFVEDAAYCRLLRKCYAEERPLPADLRAVQRLVGARTDEERDAVDVVLREFFVLSSDGWSNKRASSVIAEFSEKSEKARRSAEARWKNAAAQSERIATQHCERTAGAMRTHEEMDANASETACERNANQNQNQNQNQTDQKQKRVPRFDALAHLAGLGVEESTAKDWLTLRKQKKAPATETAIEGIVRESRAAGLHLQGALAMACERGWTGFKAEWLPPAGQPRASPADARRDERTQWARELTTTAAQREREDGRTIDV